MKGRNPDRESPEAKSEPEYPVEVTKQVCARQTKAAKWWPVKPEGLDWLGSRMRRIHSFLRGPYTVNDYASRGRPRWTVVRHC
jgi:hypothetical protein